MWQANTVAALLKTNHPGLQIEMVPVSTVGDRDRATALSAFSQTGIFTREIEDGLLRDQFDVAVHSYKDLATESPDGLIVGAVLEREDPRDAFVSRRGIALGDLPAGSVVGTSSMRRRSMLATVRPDLKLVELRGNVPTRLRAAGIEIDEGKEAAADLLDGTVLAHAGLKRLGYGQHVTELLGLPHFLPAPAQGAVAMQIRCADTRAIELLAPLDHAATRTATRAERRFMQVMEGGCQLPLGALAEVTDGGLILRAMVLNLSGTLKVEGWIEGRDADAVGEALAEQLISKGAQRILDEVRAAMVKKS